MFFAVTPAGGPKEVAKEATRPAPERAQGVKAQGLCKALRINTPLEHLSPLFCENVHSKTNQKKNISVRKRKFRKREYEKKHNKQQKQSHDKRKCGWGTTTTNHTNSASKRHRVSHVQHGCLKQEYDPAIKAP